MKLPLFAPAIVSRRRRDFRHFRPAFAQAKASPSAAPAAQLPADPWPRVVDLTNGQVLVYQPQVNKWDGNRIDFRAALAIKPTGAKDETFGVIFATARTQVDKVARTVVFEDLKITKTDFPTLPEPRRRVHGRAAEGIRDRRSARSRSTASQASLALAGIKPPTVAVQNNPPQVIVSYSPAILVPIDGAPVLKPVPEPQPRQARDQHARADPAGRLRATPSTCTSTTAGSRRTSIGGPWTQAFLGPFMLSEANAIAQELSKKGVVDLLDGGPKANPKPSLANGVPTIYTSQAPTELIVFKGQPDFVPIVGTQLLWASNTTSDVLIDTAEQQLLRAARGPLVHGGRR